MTYEEAKNLAKRHGTSGWIMRAPNGEYHYIIGNYTHWTTVAGYQVKARVVVETRIEEN